jgi:hypothetical protein
MQARNPKAEIRRKSEVRRPRSQSFRALALHPILRLQALPWGVATAPNEGPAADFGVRISDFGFPSDFGLRTSSRLSWLRRLPFPSPFHARVSQKLTHYTLSLAMGFVAKREESGPHDKPKRSRSTRAIRRRVRLTLTRKGAPGSCEPRTASARFLLGGLAHRGALD